jgi:hypothetical protein
MKNGVLMGVAALGLLAASGAALGLSIPLEQPEIRFPKGYDEARAEAIEAVLSDKRLRYIDGLYRHWPPDWPSTLVYGGDTQALHTMLAGLSRVPGVQVRVTFARDLAKLCGEGHSAGNWWVVYARNRPNVLTVRVNLASKAIDLEKLELWLTPHRPPCGVAAAPAEAPAGADVRRAAPVVPGGRK